MVTVYEQKESRTFLTIGVNGNGKVSLRQEVAEGTIGAVRRDWEVNGDTGTKWELTPPAVSGYVSGIEIKKADDKKYSDRVIITFENEVAVSTSTDGKYGQSLLRQLPNVDFTQPLKLSPYSFIPKGKDKESSGVSLKQGDGFEDKVGDYFFDFEKKESLHGIPEATFDWETVEQWEKDKFWADMDKFLQDYTVTNVIPKVPEYVAEELSTDEVNNEVDDSDINPEDIPF